MALSNGFAAKGHLEEKGMRTCSVHFSACKGLVYMPRWAIHARHTPLFAPRPLIPSARFASGRLSKRLAARRMRGARVSGFFHKLKQV